MAANALPHEIDQLGLRQLEWKEFDAAKFEDRLESNLAGCNRALALHPDTVLYDFVGLLHLQQNEPAEAIDAFKKAIEADPLNHIAYSNLKAVMAERHTPLKLPIIQYAGSTHQQLLAWSSKGLFHMKMYHRQEAIRCFTIAYELPPDDERLDETLREKVAFHLAVALNRVKHKKNHQLALKLLNGLSLESKICKFEVLSNIIEAIGGAHSKTDANKHIQRHLQKARAQFKRIKNRTPEILRAFSGVFVSAADEYRGWQEYRLAFSLFNEAIEHGQNHAGTRAYHNRAIVRQHLNNQAIAKIKEDLEKAIALEPRNYSASIDLVKLLTNSGSNSDREDALNLASRTLGQKDCNPGMMNRIVLLDLQMQLLSAGKMPIEEDLLKKILPPITAHLMSPFYKPNPQDAILKDVRARVIKGWEDFLPKDSNRLGRLIDVHIQLRLFDEASKLLNDSSNVDDEVRYQRMRITSLKSYKDKRYKDSADQLMEAAEYVLKNVAAGDLFAPGVNGYPGDDDEVPRPAPAKSFPTFRSALARSVRRSLDADPTNHTTEPQHLARCLKALQVLGDGLQSSQTAQFSSSSTIAVPGHVRLTRDLAFKTYEIIGRLFIEDPMWTRLDVPLSVMKTLAAVWRALAACGELDDKRKCMLYHYCGASFQDSVAPDESSPLIPLLRFGQQSQRAKQKLVSTVKKLIDLRKLHLQLCIMQPSAGFAAEDEAIKLVIEAKSLLDYYVGALPHCLSRKSLPKNLKLNFPSIPPNKKGSSEVLLKNHLAEITSLDFENQFPETFQVLLAFLPHQNSTANAWINNLILVRNTEAHSHAIATSSKRVPCSTTTNYAELADEIMEKLPNVLRQLKQAGETDFQKQSQPSSASSSSAAASSSQSPGAASSSSSLLRFLESVQTQLAKV